MSDKIQQPTPEQRAAMDRLLKQLPTLPGMFADGDQTQKALTDQQQTINSLRAMLESQERVSTHHWERVQELSAENVELAQAILKIGEVWDDEGYGEFFITLLNQLMRQAEKIAQRAAS